MLTKNPSTSTDVSEDGLTQPVKKKVQKRRFSITRSHDRPKCNDSRPDKHNVAPLLVEYASAKTSKTAASLPPISLGDNKTKIKTNQSQCGGGERTARDVDSVTMPANMEGAAEPLMDDAACKHIPAASAATIYLTTEAAATHIKSAASSETVVEVLPRTAGASTHINPESSPPTVDGAEVQGATPTDISTNINAVSSPAMDGGGVDVTRSTTNIGAACPPPDDGSMEALPIPVGKSTIVNSAADDKHSKITAADPSTAAGLSPGSVLKIVTTANASADGVSKLAEPVAKNTIRSDNLCESTGQISNTRPDKRGNIKNDEDY
jgi:hypothetical protein